MNTLHYLFRFYSLTSIVIMSFFILSCEADEFEIESTTLKNESNFKTVIYSYKNQIFKVKSNGDTIIFNEKIKKVLKEGLILHLSGNSIHYLFDNIDDYEYFLSEKFTEEDFQKANFCGDIELDFILYEHTNFGGHSGFFSKPSNEIRNFKDIPILNTSINPFADDMNDRMSSFEIINSNSCRSYQFWIFRDKNFSGTFRRFIIPVAPPEGTASLRVSNLKTFGLNDEVSSAKAYLIN